MSGSYKFPKHFFYESISSIMNYDCYSTLLACMVQDIFHLNFHSFFFFRVFFCMKLCRTMLTSIIQKCLCHEIELCMCIYP